MLVFLVLFFKIFGSKALISEIAYFVHLKEIL